MGEETITIKRENWKGKYRIVARKNGAFFKHSEWKPSKGLTVGYIASGLEAIAMKMKKPKPAKIKKPEIIPEEEIYEEERVWKYEIFVKCVPRMRKKKSTPEWIFSIRLLTYSNVKLTEGMIEAMWERAQDQVDELSPLYANMNFVRAVSHTLGFEERQIEQMEVSYEIGKFPKVSYYLTFWNESTDSRSGVFEVSI